MGRYPREKVVEQLRKSRPPARVPKNAVYGEANLQLSLMVPLLKELFPKSQFVWLLRDGRHVVASMYYRGWYDPFKAPGLGIWHLARLQGDETGDFDKDQWAAMGPFERCCWIWRKYNIIIENELQSLGVERWRKVHLETLKSSAVDLADFLGVPSSNGRIRVERHNARRQPVTHWREWPEEHRLHFDNLCGDVMDRWYPAWKDAQGQWQETPSEPPDTPTLLSRSKRNVKHRVHRILKKLDSYVR